MHGRYNPTKLIDWLIDWLIDCLIVKWTTSPNSLLTRYLNLPLHNTANTKQLESLPSPLLATIINGAGGGLVFKFLNLSGARSGAGQD